MTLAGTNIIMKRFSLIDSFPPTGAVKGLLNCITNSRERAMRRASIVLGLDNKERVTPISDCHTSSSSSSSSTCTLSGFETTPQELDVDTPLSWCCRGITEKADYPLESPYEKQAPLLDSQVFVFWPEDFDFACAGEGRHGRSTRRANIQAASLTRTPRAFRRWSSPQCFGFSTTAQKQQQQVPRPTAMTATAPACAQSRDVQSVSAASISITPIGKKKPTPLRMDLPTLKVSTKAHGVSTYCASNKWGNQPPAGYI